MPPGRESSDIKWVTTKRAAFYFWAVYSESFVENCVPLVLLPHRVSKSWQEAAEHKGVCD